MESEFREEKNTSHGIQRKKQESYYIKSEVNPCLYDNNQYDCLSYSYLNYNNRNFDNSNYTSVFNNSKNLNQSVNDSINHPLNHHYNSSVNQTTVNNSHNINISHNQGHSKLNESNLNLLPFDFQYDMGENFDFLPFNFNFNEDEEKFDFNLSGLFKNQPSKNCFPFDHLDGLITVNNNYNNAPQSNIMEIDSQHDEYQNLKRKGNYISNYLDKNNADELIRKISDFEELMFRKVDKLDFLTIQNNFDKYLKFSEKYLIGSIISVMHLKKEGVDIEELKKSIEPNFKNMRKSNGTKYNSNLDKVLISTLTSSKIFKHENNIWNFKQKEAIEYILEIAEKEIDKIESSKIKKKEKDYFEGKPNSTQPNTNQSFNPKKSFKENCFYFNNLPFSNQNTNIFCKSKPSMISVSIPSNSQSSTNKNINNSNIDLEYIKSNNSSVNSGIINQLSNFKLKNFKETLDQKTDDLTINSFSTSKSNLSMENSEIKSAPNKPTEKKKQR